MTPNPMPLGAPEVTDRLKRLPGWALDPQGGKSGEITRTLEFPTFPRALVFVGAVGHLAEAYDHHPDILVQYRKVTLRLCTHSAGGLTELDFRLADRINALAAEGM